MKTHICRKGEDIYRLAHENGIDSQDFLRLNGLYGNEKLCAGLGLWLPEKGCSGRLELAGWAEEGMGSAFSLPLSFLISAPRSMLEDRPNFEDFGHIPRLVCLCNTDSDGSFSPKILHSLLQDREALLSRCLQAAEGYEGLFLCTSYLYSFDRDAYSDFLDALSQKLHQKGQYLFCGLAPKAGADDYSAASVGLDFARCGKAADRIALLCYDRAHPLSPPGAAAPVDWLRSCLDYALSLIPPHKLLLGLSHMGCSWKLPWRSGDEGAAISNLRARELALSLGAEIHFDRKSRCPFFCFTDAAGQRRVVFFEDARSISEKLELVKSCRLGGILLRSLRDDAPYLRSFDIE